ncbi:hypothetical protein [Edaphobacter dinghuensis]|uniref:Alpha-L-rhamnosidase six-hairpin glycosidase domain-containing protein n=1 Tax=Edaphobacter dinghuensis TaxID=1560005 RepID=A0A917H8R7_9BACT|nr:hypothetical protein [Edaphobacter dinghuensis]GGG70398.1 hypothetical protein GCM10011585_10660 [Edaphobacter dinghuensis]
MPSSMRTAIIFSSLILSTFPLCAVNRLESAGGAIRIEVDTTNPAQNEVVSIKEDGVWVPALLSTASPTRVISEGTPDVVHSCTIKEISAIPSGLLLREDCSVGSLEERVLLTSEPDVLAVEARFTPKASIKIRSVEDRYDFAPGRRASSSLTSGLVDFVWSQNIKNEADDIVPNWSFKSPAVMLQQGKVFTALMPELSDRHSDPLALDLDVTSDKLPWLSYGAVASQPYGHSYFRRSPDAGPRVVAGEIEYRYSIVASEQPYKLGYRRVVRRLWSHEGHKELLQSNDLQQNVTRPELVTFDDWRTDTWVRYANTVYRGFDCGNQRCGTLVSNRNSEGDWGKPAPDAWFNAWFQTLRSAYGWYLYGQRSNNKDIEEKAESILNLALKSPQDHGAFPTVYMLNTKQWIRDDGWAGYADDYHTFCMSWTAYWMLQWGKNLTPNREKEILAFVRPYGDFLVKHQLSSGVIPSWYDSNLEPRSEFRDFNAETAASALLLASLGEATGDHTYANAAEQAMNFITKEVLPRQRWFDFETFKSCARKPFDFYDAWTAQYPQNNLATIQAAKAYLQLYQVTKNREYLQQGTQVLDYLLLTQQVWNNPAFSPKVVGGFTTQNTDAEWSDARQGYAAVLLWDYYKATDNQEYLERAVAAARSTFAVAPWENWAHTGYLDEQGALTGFHWGPGSALTSVEMMSPTLGDAFINLKEKQGVGFNACSLRNITVIGHSITFDLETFPSSRSIKLRFSGVDPHTKYKITWNGSHSSMVDGSTLARDGYVVQQ